MDDVRYSTVTIATGAALSGASDPVSETGRLMALITDAAWDTQAITFQVSVDGVNYFNLYNEGTEYSIAGAVASHYHRVDYSMFFGARYIKVRSGTGAAPANQNGATTVTLVYWKL